MSDKYDLVVIGGGPGGYVGAIRAAQLGLKTAIVEMRGTLGGTCLNVGCIPSKALLQSSHHFEMADKEFEHHGVDVSGLKLNLKTMLGRKEKVVDDLTKGIEFLMKKNKIDYIVGAGEIIEAGKVSVSPGKGKKKQVLETENIIIATGSEVTPLKGVKIDEKQIVSSTGALSLIKVPKEMVVIGAGVIGLELGSVWRRLGANVTVVEFLDVALPGMDAEVSKNMQRILKKQGMNFKMKTMVTGAKPARGGVTLTMQGRDDKKKETMKADVVLVAIGRRPFTDKLGLDKAGVTVDERGFIPVDEDFQTNVPGIYAIGDVIGGAMLAHKAEDEGAVCAEILSGETGHIDYDSIPGIVYTHPEVAAAGKTEEQLKEAGIEYNSGKFPFSANSRARCNADADGFVKILSDKATDRLLGCHIIGPQAGDLIQEVVNVMEFGGSAEDIARICHGHPGLPEAVKEAAMAAGGRAIHI
ncbi:MAG: dihydrolipoyl dehydrogenase [Rhodospirillaceae bacterium]|nr:dihydrolipoyl dehydrogenase [Rhodospirillaceae bacterium]MBT4749457.1 dihydrolipoyl dehydrogenase [Rhodospirillaceae bacterium]MBT5299030.1 dihydrolipoyl dehydrogenase [Rhodospirillaceae bacterium]MBT6085060.1 dihydrolipoyl dehydrogenase [Rhodospirillaceae bacterium]MBT6886072.1 dihydrolipoyl dehydrogenase [Rhodospirillaceae bacterium]